MKRHMKTITFHASTARADILHIETDLCIVNVRVGLHDADGRAVTTVEIIPDQYAGEPRVRLDGSASTRVIQELPR